MNFYKRSGNRVAKLFCSTLCGSPAFNHLLHWQINTYQRLHVFFAPQDNKYRIRCFLVHSLNFPARRRKRGTALHTHPLAGKFVPEHTGTSYCLLNAESTFYSYLIRLNVVQWNTELHVDDESSVRSSAVRGNITSVGRPLGSSSSVLKHEAIL